MTIKSKSSDSSDLPLVPPVYSFPSAYSPKVRSKLFFDPVLDRTRQSFKDECDINVIMRRYAATGQVEHLTQRTPVWGEVPNLDFNSAMQIVVRAREDFEALPANVRDRFANDPAQLLSFISNPENRAEAEKLGLVVAKSTPPQAAEVAEEKKA